MNAFDRLSTAGDIRAVFAARTVAHGPAMVVHARRRADDGPSRATVVVGRKVGDAVRRNRAKRRLRAALHEISAPRGLDVVVVGRPPALSMDFTTLTGEVGRLLERVGSRAAAGPGNLGDRGASGDAGASAPAGAAVAAGEAGRSLSGRASRQTAGSAA